MIIKDTVQLEVRYFKEPRAVLSHHLNCMTTIISSIIGARVRIRNSFMSVKITNGCMKVKAGGSAKDGNLHFGSFGMAAYFWGHVLQQPFLDYS